MKNIVYAFIISILIHFLFLFTYEPSKNPKSFKNTDKNKKTQTVRYVKLKPKAQSKKQVEQKKVEPVIEPTPKEFKKVEPKKHKKPPKRDVVKKPKKVEPRPITKTVVKPTYTKPLPKKPKKVTPKKVVKKVQKPKPIQKPKKVTTPQPQAKPESKLEDMFTKDFEKEQKSLDAASKKAQKDTLDSFLSTPDIGNDMVDSITQSYLDLYGDEFKDFTKVQKVFLKKRLKDIGRITQKYMVYPRISIRTKQHGTNVVEFTLYPNGDISSVLLSTSSGYEPLDKSSVRAINIAFKDYPRPQTPTKIKIYMSYVLY